MKKAFFLFFLFSFFRNTYAADGDTFTATVSGGVTLSFVVVSENEKTCYLGTPNNLSGAFFPSDYSGEITIPSEVNGYTVIRIGGYAFNVVFEDNNITAINIPQSMTSIGEYAFCGCINLKEITIPNSVKKIERGAFYGTGLKSIEIPNGIAAIEDLTFLGCESLSEILLPTTITTIGAYAFDRCKSLTKLDIPEGVKTIDAFAFYECDNLESISIPSSIESIGIQVFDGCNKLEYISINAKNVERWFKHMESVKEITFGNSVERIGNGSFSNGTSLTKISLSESIISIGEAAFANCSKLTQICIPSNMSNISYRAFDGCNSLTDVKILSQDVAINSGAFKNCDNLTKIEIECKDFGDCFKNKTSLKEVVLGNSVETIANNAFHGCSSITSIKLPSSIKSIGYSAFGGCSSLTSINIPNSVTSIGNSTFYNCSSLTSVNIPNSLTSIENSTFSGCSSLTSITIPNSVTNIGESAFYKCSGLTSITIPNSVTSIPNNTFYGCTNLNSLTLGYNLTSIDEKSFYGCNNLNLVIINSRNINSSFGKSLRNVSSIIISETVDSIGKEAFEYCNNLKEITIKDGVRNIGQWAFSCCHALTSIKIPNTVTNIENSAFYVCRNLNSVTLSNRLTSIKSDVFSYCDKLENVTIPNSVTCIEDFAFGNCLSLTSITIPSSVEILSGFSGCENLKNVTISSGVKTISDNAFSYCKSLLSIIIPGTVRTIGKDAFSGSGLEKIIIPEGIERIGDRAFIACHNLKSIVIPKSTIELGSYVCYHCDALEIATINCTGEIGEYAFAELLNLKSVSIGQSVTSIGERAFTGCNGLTSISIPNGRIDDQALAYCTNLSELELGSGVTSVGKDAFGDCKKLQKITLNCKTIGEWFTDNFRRFDNLKEVVLGETVEYIDSKAFLLCESIISINIPSEIKSIGDYAFESCGGLTETIVFPYSLKSIGISSFLNTRVDSIVIPSNVTFIGENAFGSLSSIEVAKDNEIYDSRNDCNAIIKTETNELISGCKNTVIPNSVTSIGDYAFAYCPDLSSITIPNSVTSIGNCAFYGCSGLTSITIPNNVTSIGESAFEGCRGLTSITIPNSVTSIGDFAFYKCNRLTSITIPNSVTRIGGSAFRYCSLISITSFITEPFSIDDDVFYGNYDSATLYVPTGFIYVYKATDGWKNFKKIEEMYASSSLTLSVTNENDADITDKVSILWYDKDGKQIGIGKSLSGIEDGTELYYSVSLDEGLGRVYREVTMREVIASGKPLTCQLEKIGRVTLEGRVSATDIDKTTMTVNVRQMLNGKWEQNYTAQTNEQGVFKVEEIYDDQTDITISGDGYLDATLHRDGFSGNGNVGIIPMSLISGFAIAANITMQKAVAGEESEETTAWTDGLNNIEFTLSNETKGTTITDFTVQNGNVIIKSGANVDDEIRLTAKSKQSVFADATTTFTIAEGTNAFVLQLTELGGFDATYAVSNNGSTSGYLYNRNDVLVAKGSYIGETLSLRHLENGVYTLISMGNSTLLGSMTHLSDISAVGLTAGSDYVSTRVEVVDGELTAVNVSEVPRLDETQFHYTNNNTYFSTNKVSVTAGNYLILSAHIDFKPKYVDKADGVTLTIDLPEGCQMVENSVIANRQVVPHTVNGNRVTITLNKEQLDSPVRFCIIPTLNQSYTISAMASFDIDGQVTQPIGIAQFEAKGLSLSTPKLTGKKIITINGTAKNHSEVSIYDNDVLIGKTSSKADGSWTTQCELYKPYSHSFHDIYAKITTESGMELTSETQQVEYDKNNLVPEKVTMLYHGSKTEFDLLEETTSPSYYSYAPSIHDFTFLADFTRNDSTVIKNVSIKVLNSDGTVRTLPATFDGKRGKWVATTKYSSSNRLPQNVKVEYDFESALSDLVDPDRQNEERLTIIEKMKSFNTLFSLKNVEIIESSDNHAKVYYQDSTMLVPCLVSINLLGDEIVNQYASKQEIDTLQVDGRNIYTVDSLYDNKLKLSFWDEENAILLTLSVDDNNNEHSRLFAPKRILSTITQGLFTIAGGNDYYRDCFELDSWYAQARKSSDKHLELFNNLMKIATAKCNNGNNKLSKIWLTNVRDWYLSAKKMEDRFDEQLRSYYNHLWIDWGRNTLINIGLAAGGYIVKGLAAAKIAWLGSIGSTWYTRLTSSVVEGVVDHTISSTILKSESNRSRIANWYHSEEAQIYDKYNDLRSRMIRNYGKCPKDKEKEEEDEEDDEEKKDVPMDEKSENNSEFRGNGSTALIDPSGFVYEAVLTNRLEGVTTTCYQQENGAAVVWNAEDYSQQNPLKTDKAGFYRWDVPQGMWQVKYEKEGYETAYSDWLPVPPPQLDVNIGMKQSTPPTVKQMRGYESGITIELSKYMRPETMTTEKITVTRNGSAETGSIELMNAEQAPLGDETYVSKVKFVPENRFNATDLVVVTVHKEVESYCGVQMTADHVETVKIESEVKSIVADSLVTVPYQGERELRIVILPKDASAGRTLKVKTSSAMIASVSAEEVTIGQDGAATLTLGGELPGGAILDFSVDGTDVKTTSRVKVVMGREMVAKPVANISSGLTISGGTQIKLTCETEGATIYYTLDGSCPCDEATRHKYDGPFTIATDVIVKAIAVKDDMDDSDIATFVYIVDGIDGINYNNRFGAIYLDGSVVVTGAKGASCHIYDLQGREVATRLHLSNQATISVPKTEIYVVSVTFDDGQTVVKKVVRKQ